MSKSEQLIEQEGRYGVDEEVCFHFPLDSDDFFIDVISWIASLVNKNERSAKLHQPKPTGDPSFLTQSLKPVVSTSSLCTHLSYLPTILTSFIRFRSPRINVVTCDSCRC